MLHVDLRWRRLFSVCIKIVRKLNIFLCNTCQRTFENTRCSMMGWITMLLLKLLQLCCAFSQITETVFLFETIIVGRQETCNNARKSIENLDLKCSNVLLSQVYVNRFQIILFLRSKTFPDLSKRIHKRESLCSIAQR